MVKRLGRTIEKFKKKHPSLTRRAQGLADEIVQRSSKVDSNSFALTHGDFLPKNVLHDGSSLTVIDLGGISLFDPSKNVGKFIGHFVVKAQKYSPVFDPQALRELFLKNYAQEYSTKFWERIVASEARCYFRRSSKESDHESAVCWLHKGEECLREPGRESMA